MWSENKSVYTEKFADNMGIFFTEKEFPALKENGDVSDVLQKAIEQLVAEQRYGILYIPEGEYRIGHTVKIPPAVRLIGYGKNRPVFVMPQKDGGGEKTAKDNPQNRMDFENGYPGADYMLWFIGEADVTKERPRDANAGTFYSAISNIDFRIEGKQPNAICIRAHFAQNCFVSHAHFELGDGLAGIFDVGNEMEDLTFSGGDYGIVCRMCSQGWPFVLLDSSFEYQKKAAVLSGMTGFTGVRLKIKNTPCGFDLYIPGAWEKLCLKDCVFENIRKAAVTCCGKRKSSQQINIETLYCSNVPALLLDEETQEITNIEEEHYLVERYVSGYGLEERDSFAAYQEQAEIRRNVDISAGYAEKCCDVPPVPDMKEWVSVMDYGAKGNGIADDTEAVQRALNGAEVVYFPQGIYRITESLIVEKKRTLIGMSPITTQIAIKDDTQAFSGFGTPKALLEVEAGCRCIISGIGIDTAGKNPRAVGIRWRAGSGSYMNDIKFIGGHGTMYRDGRNAFDTIYNASRTADYDATKRWDNQYPSLWITENGGGTFKDIWSASPYAEAGIAITSTRTPGRMYQISLEHHVRNEMKLYHVENWEFYGIQTEEEKAEGMSCLPLEIVSCRELCFFNFYLFRVVAVDRSFETGIRLWNSSGIEFKNLYNKAQMQYTFMLSLKNETTGFCAKFPEYAYLKAGEGEKRREDRNVQIREIAAGNGFAQGACIDGDGNLYWCDKENRRIFRYDRSKDEVMPLIDIHFVPSALFLDKKGHMFVAVDYSELMPKEECNPFAYVDHSSNHPLFMWFYRRSARAYAFSIEDPFNTLEELLPVPAEKVAARTVVRPAELDYPGKFAEAAARRITSCFLMPDGETAVEDTVDLARSIRLCGVTEGEKAFLTDDSARCTYAYEVLLGGNYGAGTLAADRGQYGVYEDGEGTVWAADDYLYAYRDGICVRRMEIPVDVHSIIGNGKAVYLIGRHSVYRCRL